MKNITAEQCRAARAMLGWSRDLLEHASGVTARTITDFERGAREPRQGTKQSLIEAFDEAGLELIPANGGGAGLRFKRYFMITVDGRICRPKPTLEAAQAEALSLRTGKEALLIELPQAPAPTLAWRYDDEIEAWVETSPE